MDLLDLLVTNQTKKKLLKALWKEGVVASAHQLSLMTESAYSTTYEELEQFVKNGVVFKTSEGRAQLYSKNPNFEGASALDALLEPNVTQNEVVTDEEVVNNLGAYGAPLGNFAEPKTKLSLEETLARAVLLSLNNATLARVLPLTFWKNEVNLDFKKLFYFAHKFEVTRQMGFYLDLTGYLSKNKKFNQESRVYKDKRFKKAAPFFQKASQSKYAQLLEEQNTPELSRKWKFTMNMDLESFASLFNKFSHQPG